MTINNKHDKPDIHDIHDINDVHDIHDIHDVPDINAIHDMPDIYDIYDMPDCVSISWKAQAQKQRVLGAYPRVCVQMLKPCLSLSKPNLQLIRLCCFHTADCG